MFIYQMNNKMNKSLYEVIKNNNLVNQILTLIINEGCNAKNPSQLSWLAQM